MAGRGVFSQPLSQVHGAYDVDEITATQLGSQVDFSFLDFNTQDAALATPSLPHYEQVRGGT